MKVCVVYVRENAKELPVHVFCSRGKAGWKCVPCLGGKRAFVVEKILTPGHYIVDVGWGCQLDAFAFVVYPRVVQSVKMPLMFDNSRGAIRTPDQQTLRDMHVGYNTR